MDDEIKVVEDSVEEMVVKVEEKVSEFDGVVEEWFQKHFHGVHGLDTVLYNRFHAAKEELKQILGDSK